LVTPSCSGRACQAEKYLSQALESARDPRPGVLKPERAFSSEALQTDPMKQFANLGRRWRFTSRGGYRSGTFSCLASLARAIRKGDYDAGAKSHDQLFQLA